MKTVASIAAAFALILGVTACGDDEGYYPPSVVHETYIDQDGIERTRTVTKPPPPPRTTTAKPTTAKTTKKTVQTQKTQPKPPKAKPPAPKVKTK